MEMEALTPGDTEQSPCTVWVARGPNVRLCVQWQSKAPKYYMLYFEQYDAFVGLGLNLLALSVQILNRKNGEVGSIWSHGAWSKQACSKSRQSSLERNGTGCLGDSDLSDPP